LRTRFRFVLLAAILATSSVNAKSPWTQDKGGGFVQLSWYGIGPYERLFQSSGDDFRLNREITDSTVQAYGEFGLTDRWTLVTSVPFKLLDAGDLVTDPTLQPTTIQSGSVSNIGNLVIGGRRSFIDKGYVLSAQFDLELPTGSFDEQTGLSSGYDAYTLTPAVGAGKGWKRAYVYGYLGFGLRSDDFSSDVRGGVEGGYRFFGRLWLIGLLDIVSSFENGDVLLPRANLETGLYVNNQEYVAYGVKALIDVTERFGIQLTYYTAAQGNNVANSPLSGFGLYYKW
jgi:hypothetical protein